MTWKRSRRVERNGWTPVVEAKDGAMTVVVSRYKQETLWGAEVSYGDGRIGDLRYFTSLDAAKSCTDFTRK